MIAERTSNKDEILGLFTKIIPQEKWRLLEVGSGTGHHAVNIAAQLTQLQWVASDTAHRQNAIRKTISEAKLPNVHGPIEYEIGKDEFPTQKFNAAFASQVIHELHWKQTKSLVKVLGNRLRKGSQVLFYGPFKVDGKFESDRVEDLDRRCKEKDPQSGVRALEDMLKIMDKAGFVLVHDHALAGENHFLHFERREHGKL